MEVTRYVLFTGLLRFPDKFKKSIKNLKKRDDDNITIRIFGDKK